jgi:two-component system sensor histidine kinase CiaH
MIKRLRKKFILTNMLLVALVLITVFGVLVGYNYQRLVRQSEEAMRTALKWSDDAPPPVFQFGASHEEEMEEQGEERRFTMVPVFVVLLDEDGGPAQVTGGNNVEVSDQVVAQAVAAATEESGAISGLNPRYLQDTDRGGENSRIAFADMGWETDSLWPLIRSSLLVGALALGGFFVISLMLSGLALKPAEEAWEQQRRFVADASHERKTPLTVILTNTGILLAHSGDTIAQQQKWVEYIRDEAQRMRALVEDLLFLAKSDAGKETSPVTAPVDVSELTWSALLPFEPVAFEQGVEMESEIADQLTVQGNADQLTVQGNADQLRRLVAILLDNAVKYAGNGGRVKLVLSRPERGGVCLTVHNTGPAIPPEHLPHLFERFYRADDSRARTSGGYGLGLAIAKRIVDGHGGSITVSSREDASTDFTVRLPHSQ